MIHKINYEIQNLFNKTGGSDDRAASWLGTDLNKKFNNREEEWKKREQEKEKIEGNARKRQPSPSKPGTRTHAYGTGWGPHSKYNAMNNLKTSTSTSTGKKSNTKKKN